MQIKDCAFSPDNSGGLESPFSSWYKGDIFAIEDFLFECKYPLQKGNFYSVFKTSLSTVS